ncbi:MAG: DegV family protein [Candidatus Kariarchaeaceae archaeon]
MSKIAIVSDTAADMSAEFLKKYDIHMVNAFVTIGTDVYVLGDLEIDEFYTMMEHATAATWPKTSQPRAHDLLEVYEQLKSQGYTHILSIHVASTLSGTINSANVAKGMIDEIDIRIIDSRGVSANLTAVLIKARELIDSKKDIDTIITELDEFSNGLTSYLTLATLENLVKGGRISKINFFLGSLLKIKPILRLHQSELAAFSKARGFDKAVSKVYEIATKGREPSDSFNYIIAHTRVGDQAKTMEAKLLAEFPKAKGFIMEIGIVVAVHAGPGGLLLMVY